MTEVLFEILVILSGVLVVTMPSQSMLCIFLSPRVVVTDETRLFQVVIGETLCYMFVWITDLQTKSGCSCVFLEITNL